MIMKTKKTLGTLSKLLTVQASFTRKLTKKRKKIRKKLIKQQVKMVNRKNRNYRIKNLDF